MKNVKEISISLQKRTFTMDLAIEDEELIEAILSAFKEHVKRGCALKVKQAYVTSLSDSLRIISKIISTSSQMDEWRAEIRQLISVVKKGG